MKYLARTPLLILFIHAFLFAQQPYVVHNVAVIDLENGSILENRDVTIDGSRITKIKPVVVDLTEEQNVVNGTNKFLIPGLRDMHTHSINTYLYDQFLQLMIANGVVGFRDTWGNLELAESIRQEMRDGQRPSMIFQVAGNLVDGKPPIWPGANVASDSAAAVTIVDSLTEAGAEFIKGYSRLSSKSFYALAKRAGERGIRFMGHIPGMVKVADASNAGMHSIEHLTGILRATSQYEDSIFVLQAKANGFWARWDLESARAVQKKITRLGISGFSREKAITVFELLKENQTWQVPTLVTNRAYAYMNDSTLTNDPRRSYLNKGVTQTWDVKNNNFLASRSPESWQIERDKYQAELKLVGLMHEVGVPLLAGTDPPNPWCFPGFSLHDEMGLLVSAGLTPLAALQTATLNPALFNNAADSLGLIKPNYRADLLLLNANPLEDIANTREIEAVIAGGELLTRDRLDAMLSRIFALNSKKSIHIEMVRILRGGTLEQALAFYDSVKTHSTGQYDLLESELNRLGYYLLSRERADEAIVIFKLNVDNYPESANVYDSLGDAYRDAGRIDEAISSYQKVLKLDPDGEFGRLAREAIAELERKTD